MPQHSERLILEASLEDVYAASQRAVADMGWRVFKQDGKGLVFKEVSPKHTSSTWPVEIQVRLASIAQGTGVEIFGSNFGFGPIQGNHVRGQVGSFINRLQVSLQQLLAQKAVVPPPAVGNTLITELERLVNLHNMGGLTDAEFSLAKQRLLEKPV